MALTRDQLTALSPPDGWRWDTRVSLRSHGVVIADSAQGWSFSTAPARIQRLAKWAIDNELGIKFDSQNPSRHILLEDHNYGRVYVGIRWKVWANKPEYTKNTFAEHTCPCGASTAPIGTIFLDPCCGSYHCRDCGTAGMRLHQVGGRGRGYCSTCTIKCKHSGCNERLRNVNAPEDGKCLEHSDNILCTFCGTRRSREGSKELSSEDYPRARGQEQRKYFACKSCVSRSTCAECKRTSFRTPLHERDGKRVCDICIDKKDDEKLGRLEQFSADELPAGGSLVIPSLPSRPFRTVSIETEMNGDGPYVARRLYRCGMVPIPSVGGYHTYPDTENGEYIAYLKHDGSVTGGELIAFLMNLDDERHADSFMDLLKKVQGLHKANRIEFGSNCGGHIHVDAHNFGYGSVWRLLTGFNYAEDVIFRIAGAGSPYGHRTLDSRHGRYNGGHGYSNSPVKGPFGTKGAVGRQIEAQDRNCGLNFQPFLQAVRNCTCGAWAYEDSRTCKCNLGKATIEWRVFNSTHNPRIIHAWIALVQALHAWADEEVDPTAEWENRYPALAWQRIPFNKTSTSHQREVKRRLEWLHTDLPLTDNERDSLCYAIEHSDMGPVLGKNYIDRLKVLSNTAEHERPKIARNPARRKRDIKIESPEPGKLGPVRNRNSSPFRTPSQGRATRSEQFILSTAGLTAPAPQASAPIWDVIAEEVADELEVVDEL